MLFRSVDYKRADCGVHRGEYQERAEPSHTKDGKISREGRRFSLISNNLLSGTYL